MKDLSSLNNDEDAEIVSACRNGDLDAFEILVRKYQKKMLNIAYRMTGSYDDACDIVQDAFVSAYRSLHDFQGRSRFSTWLYSILVNTTRNRLRQIQTRDFHEPLSLDDPVTVDDDDLKHEYASGETSALERLEKRQIRHQVQECISSLDSEFRDVIVLRDIQGFAYDEISEMLKIAEGTVKSRLFRARESVRNCLKRLMGEL